MNIKRLIIFGLILIKYFLLSNLVSGQSITNVKATFENEKIIVTYDMDSNSPRERYKIKLTFRDTEGNTIIPKSVEGDFNYITGGNNKKIIWDISIEYYDFTRSIKPILTIVDTYKILGGPYNAFLSVLVPGLGNHKVSDKRNSALNYKTYTTLGLLGYSLFQKIRSDNLYDDYMNATEYYIDDYYKKANTAHYHSYFALRAGLAIWIADVIWVACKGAKNEKKNKNILNANNLSYYFNYNQDELTLRLVYKF